MFTTYQQDATALRKEFFQALREADKSEYIALEDEYYERLLKLIEDYRGKEEADYYRTRGEENPMTDEEIIEYYDRMKDRVIKGHEQ